MFDVTMEGRADLTDKPPLDKERVFEKGALSSEIAFATLVCFTMSFYVGVLCHPAEGTLLCSVQTGTKTACYPLPIPKFLSRLFSVAS